MARNKQETVTFKADASLLEAMRGVPNRSEFIRDAILTALESVCPLCMGTGILTPTQKAHWDSFAEDHPIEECGDCHELHLTCPTASAAHSCGDARQEDR